MIKANSADVQRNFRSYRESAERGETIVVQHYNKPSVVIVSVDEYARLKRRDKKAMRTEELPDWVVDRIAEAEMDHRFARLDRAS